MYLKNRTEHCCFLSLKHNLTRTGQGPLYLDMVPDDCLTHNSIMVSTREDCFTTRRRSVEKPQMHTQIDFLTPSVLHAFQEKHAFVSPLTGQRNSNWHGGLIRKYICLFAAIKAIYSRDNIY